MENIHIHIHMTLKSESSLEAPRTDLQLLKCSIILLYQQVEILHNSALRLIFSAALECKNGDCILAPQKVS